jgi:hypothetical protein
MRHRPAIAPRRTCLAVAGATRPARLPVRGRLRPVPALPWSAAAYAPGEPKGAAHMPDEFLSSSAARRAWLGHHGARVYAPFSSSSHQRVVCSMGRSRCRWACSKGALDGR